MLLFLIGLPGSGKTTLGKEIASLVNIQFIDLDQAIVKTYGSSIDNIFAEQGEAAFRVMEKDTLHALQDEKKNGLVVATGGGAPCFYDNMEWMNKHGVTLFLNPPLSELASRLSKAKNTHRPMLKDLSTEDTLAFLKEKSVARFPFYNQAQLILTQTSPTVSDIKNRLQTQGLLF
jgi:shikimate kinase